MENFKAFLDTLPIMAIGMFGIFAVILAIYLCIIIMLKIFKAES